MNRNTDTYSEQSVTETLNGFGTQADQGLTDVLASQRIEQYGYNEIEEKE